jgi:hypothetical protein
MHPDDLPDDEEWYEEDDEDEDAREEFAGQCPACSGPIYILADKCPACGYWLSDSDRRSMWTSESQPPWIRVTSVLVLTILLIGSLLWVF